jgi:glycerophosphoryl diester phosphodiesterase
MQLMRWKTVACAWAILFLMLPAAHGGILRSNQVLLLCHRTANRDLPENTLESLALAARMGCNIVEVDVRRTSDGKLVLNHDGFLDRFTDTTGEVENTDLRELDQMDFGIWMGKRYAGMRIAHFDDVLRMARDLKVGLYLDIKTKGIGPQVLAALAREDMMNDVIFGGEWDDIRRLNTSANADQSAWLQPGLTRERVQTLHQDHKIVIANFILNGREFDLRAMKEAVAYGVDGIMVDYPRLGAEAVGRPVEQKIQSLSTIAETGRPDLRIGAIRELSYYTGFPLQRQFFRWLMDNDAGVSHEAALALLASRPQPLPDAFEDSLRSRSMAARINSVWAIGVLARSAADGAQCAKLLAPLLHDSSAAVIKQTLVGLSRCQADSKSVPADALLRILTGPVPVLRGLAAVALATHHPAIAERAVTKQLEQEEKTADSFNIGWTARGRPKLSQNEIDKTVEIYRAEVKELQALALLRGEGAYQALAAQAFRPGHDYSMIPILMAGFDIWDHLAKDPAPALEALKSRDAGEADWAEWALVKSGPNVLPDIRSALPASQGELRRRLIEILAWQADEDALPLLRALKTNDESERDLVHWAISTIDAFRPSEKSDGKHQ